MRQSALNRAITLANDASVYNDPNRINTQTDKIIAVSAADVQRVARAYLKNYNRILIETTPARPPAGQPAATTPKPPVQ
jgi:predicted Zn-dependent peptidase